MRTLLERLGFVLLFAALITFLLGKNARILVTDDAQRGVSCYRLYLSPFLSCLPSDRLVRVLNIYEPVPNRPYQVRLGATVLLERAPERDSAP